jgi:hypothetical protein
VNLPNGWYPYRKCRNLHHYDGKGVSACGEHNDTDLLQNRDTRKPKCKACDRALNTDKFPMPQPKPTLPPILAEFNINSEADKKKGYPIKVTLYQMSLITPYATQSKELGIRVYCHDEEQGLQVALQYLRANKLPCDKVERRIMEMMKP